MKPRTQNSVTRLNSPTESPAKRPFYQRTWFLIFSLIFISPLGVFLWYKFHPKPKTKLLCIIKKTISIVLILFWLMMYIGTYFSYSRNYKIDGVEYRLECSKDCSKIDRYGDSTALQTLAVMGVEDIYDMPDKLTNSEAVITERLDYKNLTTKLTLVYKDNKLIKVYKTDEANVIYYSADQRDTIVSYKDSKDAIVASIKAQEETNKQTQNNPIDVKTEEEPPKQEVSTKPKIDFYGFADWYQVNKNTIMNNCGNSDFTEQQTLDCLKDSYKYLLEPELFTKANENDRSNLISAIARICGGVSKYGDVDTAEALYKKWSVKE